MYFISEILFIIFTSRNQLFKKKRKKQSFPHICIFFLSTAVLPFLQFPSGFFFFFSIWPEELSLTLWIIFWTGTNWLKSVYVSVSCFTLFGRMVWWIKNSGLIVLFFFLSALETCCSIFAISPRILLRTQTSFKSSFLVGEVLYFSELFAGMYLYTSLVSVYFTQMSNIC